MRNALKICVENHEGKVLFRIPRYRWKEILKLVLNKLLGYRLG